MCEVCFDHRKNRSQIDSVDVFSCNNGFGAEFWSFWGRLTFVDWAFCWDSGFNLGVLPGSQVHCCLKQWLTQMVGWWMIGSWLQNTTIDQNQPSMIIIWLYDYNKLGLSRKQIIIRRHRVYKPPCVDCQPEKTRFRCFHFVRSPFWCRHSPHRIQRHRARNRSLAWRDLRTLRNPSPWTSDQTKSS